jgi:uncharacterized protein
VVLFAMKCPICKRDVEEMTPQGERNRFHPFCSERCKLVDLGRWLGGKYQIPVVERDEGSSPGRYVPDDED